MNLDFQWYQYALIVVVFIWSGFVRAGFGFGGALFTIPFLLLIHNDPLFFLPIISIHLLIFCWLTLFFSPSAQKRLQGPFRGTPSSH